MDFGVIAEGFVEQDSSGRMVLRIPQPGQDVYLDIQAELAKHQGKEVRLIVTPLEAIAKLAKMIEGGDVMV